MNKSTKRGSANSYLTHTKQNRGITLVALVITIIVLIILAAVSINVVMNGGLIQNAKDAKESHQVGAIKQQDALEYLEAATTHINTDITSVNTAETNPAAALPDGAIITQGDASKGIVIKDTNNNEWVWVEVPKSIYTTTTVDEGYSLPTNSEDYTNIEHVMQKYAVDYREYPNSDEYYSGCGFASETEYNNYKNSILKSIYENGGFWIGRYEAGTRTARFAANDELTAVVVQKNAYPYNWVTVKQAQEKATTLSTGGKTSGLMLGIQWDLTLKFIETNGYLSDGTKLEQDDINSSSYAWANYGQHRYTLDRGKYYIINSNKWIDFDITTSGYVDNKVKSGFAGLTTGAADRNRVLNIYDIAGNFDEWTLEINSSSNRPVVRRGGWYGTSSVQSACKRDGRNEDKCS